MRPVTLRFYATWLALATAAICAGLVLGATLFAGIAW